MRLLCFVVRGWLSKRLLFRDNLNSCVNHHSTLCEKLRRFSSVLDFEFMQRLRLSLALPKAIWLPFLHDYLSMSAVLPQVTHRFRRAFLSGCSCLRISFSRQWSAKRQQAGEGIDMYQNDVVIKHIPFLTRCSEKLMRIGIARDEKRTEFIFCEMWNFANGQLRRWVLAW